MKKQLLFILMMVLPMVAWAQELIPFEDSTSELYGYKDKTGKVVIPGATDKACGVCTVVETSCRPGLSHTVL